MLHPTIPQHAALELHTESGTGLLALVLKCSVGCLPTTVCVPAFVQDEVLIAGFGRRGHAVGDIPGVRFKVQHPIL